MDERVPKSKISQFSRPEEAFTGLGAHHIGELVLSSCDLSLIIDAAGIIRDTACWADTVFENVLEDWIESHWHDTVTPESRSKISQLLKDAGDPDRLVWRQVNHATGRLGDIPVSYAVVELEGSGHRLALGRDMRKSASEQRRLMNAQLSMERAYARLQASEMRYRQMFQTAGEAICVIDCTNMRVLEANLAAVRLFGTSAKKLEGRRIKDLLSAAGLNLTDALMQAALGGKIVRNVEVVNGPRHHVNISSLLLREDKRPVLILRLTPMLADGVELNLPEKRAAIEAVHRVPDGFVVTRPDGEIVIANSAFAELIQVINTDKLWGDRFDRWFDRTGVDYNVLISNLREHGIVRRFATQLRGEAGSSENVEIAAVEVKEGVVDLHAFVLRPTGASDRPQTGEEGLLPYSAEQLTSLVGHMSLKEVVRETTSVIERLCIEAALELTGDNRASAAQLLGLSRQSLYDKLAKIGIDNS
ncbi:MAG: transcriptional regulator PpsR [Pseudomonadota bacterium]